MWVRIELKAPDEGEWIALTNVTSDGEAETFGYINRNDFLDLHIPLGRLLDTVNNYIAVV